MRRHAENSRTVRRWTDIARKAREARSGATAVEFALVAPIFFGLIFSIFEIGWFYFINSQVDAATTETARLVRTGQVQKANLTKEQFFDEVCNRLVVIGDCDNSVTVEVQRFASFAALAADTSTIACADDGSAEVQALPYDPGSDNDVVRLRVCVLYKTINPALGANVADRANGKRRLYGNYLLRNEPYSRSAN
jgi:Flp pilus assembly protein TadG